MTDDALRIDSTGRSLAAGQVLAVCVDAIVVVMVVLIGRIMQRRVEIGQTFTTAAIGYSLASASFSGAWMSLGPQSQFSRLLFALLICIGGFLLAMVAMSLAGASADAIAIGA